MNPYQAPSIIHFTGFSNFVRLQGTGGGTPTDGGGQPQTPITCEGAAPEGCSFFSSDINSNCISFSLTNYNINALIPNIDCSAILSQCSITINGQDAAAFCDSSFNVESSADCGGSCAVQWDCFTTNPCTATTVEISCPGYISCDTTAITF